jgi:Tetracyclin repressor-like, C-terminal domain
MLAAALEAGIAEGELAADTDVDAVVSMLIGSFYGVYVARGRIPKDWPERVVHQLWPAG